MIYAISDCHGDYKQALKLLQKHKIVNIDGNWIAGDSTLICNGDSTDRGNEGIKLLSLMLKLSNQAKDEGGRVIHTMGNHDALILCVALEYFSNEYNYEHSYIFNINGGKNHEAISLSKMHKLREYVQSFPLMCRVDDILFQHADGFKLYKNASKDASSPDEKIKSANAYCKDMTSTHLGAWSLFYDLTDERFWQNKPELMEDYLQSFGAKIVVHGHTGFKGTEPLSYLDDMAINVDAIMSRGYRSDDNRGCVLVIDSPGKDIVV